MPYDLHFLSIGHLSHGDSETININVYIYFKWLYSTFYHIAMSFTELNDPCMAKYQVISLHYGVSNLYESFKRMHRHAYVINLWSKAWQPQIRL